ncbi:MAG: hypothetical protein N2Z62_10135 [Rhodobacteraceae bacterium]|nr:hypothetical protein [Paracoccaceae bacterium]
MSDGRDRAGLDLGVYGRRGGRPRAGAAVVVAGALTAVWLALVGGFLLAADLPGGGLGPFGPALVLATVVFPVAVIWVGALAVRAAQLWREDAARLEAAIDALRHAYVTQSQTAGMAVRPVERRPDAAAGRGAETALAAIVPRREGGAERRPALATRRPDVIAPAPSDAQASLALGTPAESPREPLTTEEFIRALNFPDDEHDREGFRALRRALEDRDAARLVRASQDVLTLLSQDGIYMDDLRPDRARPEVWRRFAEGERGRSIAALGGVRDRSSLALTAARMRRDEIFRDAAHHFLRHFDRAFSAFAAGATDQEIADLAETRTARAFMLIGRVAGTFD